MGEFSGTVLHTHAQLIANIGGVIQPKVDPGVN